MGMALGTPFPALGSGQVGLFHLPPTCPGVPATCGNPGALSPGGMSAKGPLWTLTHYRPSTGTSPTPGSVGRRSWRAARGVVSAARGRARPF